MADVIRVRMYRVGFGDAFLVSFPSGHHVLIDCGSLSEGREHLRRVVQDIAEASEGHLSVVVASHRHGDHINGFAAAEDLFGELRIDEVWLPWTEDPTDTVAHESRRRLDRLAALLAERTEGTLQLLASNSATTESALAVLSEGLARGATRRYLELDDEEFESPALPGVRARVLAPSRTPADLQRLLLESGLALATAEELGERKCPFRESLILDRRTARRLFKAELGRKPPLEDNSELLEEQLCFWLDKTINNTSLVLLLRVGRIRLLFGGDAQWQAWMSVINGWDMSHELGAVAFLKVAHHGSITGTPERLLELLGAPRCMVSTSSEQWSAIPKRSLLAELGRKGPLVRSDKPGRGHGFRVAERSIDCELSC